MNPQDRDWLARILPATTPKGIVPDRNVESTPSMSAPIGASYKPRPKGALLLETGDIDN